MAHLAAGAQAPRCLPQQRSAAPSPRLGRLSSTLPHAPFAGASRAVQAAQQRRCLRLRTAAPPTDPAAAQDGAAPADRSQQLVDKVLAGIEGTDSGDKMSPSARTEVDACLNELDQIGDAKALRPLADPLVFGNYNVAYVSTGDRQAGQPAGGRFRGGLGKLLFRTTFLGQSVLQPDVVTNKVAFRLFGFLPGSVGLRGKFLSIPEREGGENRQDTVKVFFEPPVLSLPGGIHVRIGPPSTVVLKTTYVDERVRLGKGSRGSLFVFTRGGQSDEQGMDQVGLQQCSTVGKFVLFGIVAALMLNGGLLAAKAALPPVIRAAGIVQVLLGLALGGICYRGGIIQDNEDRPEVEKPAGGGDQAAPEAA